MNTLGNVIWSMLRGSFFWIWTVVIGGLGNIDFIKMQLPQNWKKCLSQIIVFLGIDSMINYFETTWGYWFLGGIGIYIFGWFFSRTRYYLGDKVKTRKVNILPDDMRTDKIHHAWIKIENNEHFDLEDCYADLKVVKVESKGTWQPLQALNPTLSKLTWPEFNKGEIVKVRRGNSERIDIAKVDSDAIFFIFQSGEIGIYARNHFYLEITVNGETNGKPIKELVFKGFLRYKVDFIQIDNDKELQIDVDFENYQRLYLEPGEIEND